MKKHINIPVFIPHLACPNDCIFCNQKSISATKSAPDAGQVYELIQKAIKTIDFSQQSCEVAFFGGSFTGIEEGLMCEYLECASKFSDVISGIRLSTRPDYISPHILDILKKYNVTSIELGMQSMNDAVLSECGRGHDSAATEKASKLIKENGFELVLQMMTGLPGDTPESTINTAKVCARLKPNAVRIYPCIVLKNTKLCEMYHSGAYIPPSLEDTVNLCSDLILFFEDNDIRILRVGLFSEYSMMRDDIVAGPYHPAFGELCENKIYFDIISRKLNFDHIKSARVVVGKGELSKAVGQHRCNAEKLCNMHGIEKLIFSEDENITPRETIIDIIK